MNVLHINTCDRGGAAQAAIRLHRGLLNQSVNSKFLSLQQTRTNEKELYQFSRINDRNLLKKIFNRLGLFLNNSEKNRKKIKEKSLGRHETFTFPQTDYDITNHELFKVADIINLHWVADFLDYPSFFRKVDKPIIWTLHDMSPFMGGFHYENDICGKKDEFLILENQLRDIKERAIHSNNNITVITPSKWLGEYSKKSLVFGGSQTFVIPNGLDTKIFRPREKMFCRELFDIPADAKIILFSAGNITGKRKGFSIFLKAIKELDIKKYYFIALGSYDEKTRENLPVNFLGYIDDERLNSCVYSAADVFVMPGLEDNLPNTILESIACGTPVIGSNTGGIPDVVRPGINGELFEPANSEELADNIEKYFSDIDLIKKMSRNCREIAVCEYDSAVQAKKYIRLYEKILDQ